jgi:hypothetical protein
MEIAIAHPLDYFRLSELIYRLCVLLVGWFQRSSDRAVEQRAQEIVALKAPRIFWIGFGVGAFVVLILVFASIPRQSVR